MEDITSDEVESSPENPCPTCGAIGDHCHWPRSSQVEVIAFYFDLEAVYLI